MKTTVALTLALAAAIPAASAQDTNAAAEWARLANQRILAESEQRKQEVSEDAQTQPAAAAVPAASTAAASPPISSAPKAELPVVEPAPPGPATGAMVDSSPSAEQSGDATTESGSRNEMSVVLEQLRTLGELRDAGYVSDDEFDRIKQRILDGNL